MTEFITAKNDQYKVTKYDAARDMSERPQNPPRYVYTLSQETAGHNTLILFIRHAAGSHEAIIEDLSKLEEPMDPDIAVRLGAHVLKAAAKNLREEGATQLRTNDAVSTLELYSMRQAFGEDTVEPSVDIAKPAEEDIIIPKTFYVNFGEQDMTNWPDTQIHNTIK